MDSAEPKYESIWDSFSHLTSKPTKDSDSRPNPKDSVKSTRKVNTFSHRIMMPKTGITFFQPKMYQQQNKLRHKYEFFKLSEMAKTGQWTCV